MNIGPLAMPHAPNFSSSAALIADPTRARMLTALMSGRALPAGELAYASGVTPQTASAHLAQLLEGGLLALEREGRHRYYRLAGPHIAEAISSLTLIRPNTPLKRKALSPKARDLRFCRRCYDHLAGQLSVAVTSALEEHGFIIAAADKKFDISDAGRNWFGSIGLNVDALKPARRGLARQCLDCTERRHHLAGPLGGELLTTLFANGWVLGSKDSRAVRVTPKGQAQFKHHLGVEPDLIKSSAD